MQTYIAIITTAYKPCLYFLPPVAVNLSQMHGQPKKCYVHQLCISPSLELETHRFNCNVICVLLWLMISLYNMKVIPV